MHIQWYPGHMHKASKEIKEILPRIDLIIEVLDSRIPYSSQNPMLSKLRGEIPCIRVLSKTDLAAPERTELWQNYLELEQGVKTLAVTTEEPEKIKLITQLCHKMVPEKGSNDKASDAIDYLISVKELTDKSVEVTIKRQDDYQMEKPETEHLLKLIKRHIS